MMSEASAVLEAFYITSWFDREYVPQFQHIQTFLSNPHTMAEDYGQANNSGASNAEHTNQDGTPDKRFKEVC